MEKAAYPHSMQHHALLQTIQQGQDAAMSRNNSMKQQFLFPKEIGGNACPERCWIVDAFLVRFLVFFKGIDLHIGNFRYMVSQI